MSKNALDRSVLDIISDPEFGTPDDKLRLFLVFYICSPNITDVNLLFFLCRIDSKLPVFTDYIGRN